MMENEGDGMVCEIRLGSHTLQLKRQLLRDGHRVAIGPRALAILTKLAEHKNEVVTKDELIKAVWPNVIVEENTLYVHLAALRKALGEDAELIETVRSVGYVLHVEDDVPEAASDAFGAATAFSRAAQLAGGASRSNMGRYALAALLMIAGLALLAFVGAQVVNRQSAQIALVPFEVTSGDHEEIALAGGITDELIFRLRRIDGLAVSTVTADAAPEGKVVKGRLQSDGQTMRLAVRLEDREGEVLWSEIFNSDLDQLFNVQEEIARNVAGVLSVSLKVGAESRSYGGTDNPEAYVNYLQGRINRQNQDREVPTAYLERALVLDPDYPKALTEATFVDGITLYWPMEQEQADRLIGRMDRLSSHALRVAPDVWQSHAARGWHVLLARDFVSADTFHMTVEQLDAGNDPELLNVLANYHMQMGRNDRSAKFRRVKAIIDPIFPAEDQPRAVLYRRDFDRVITMHARKDNGYLVDGNAYAPIDLYWALRLSGSIDQARELARAELYQSDEMAHVFTMDHSEHFPDLPYPELANWAQRSFGTGGRSVLASLAHHASQLGKHRLAMDYLRLAYEDRVAMGGWYALWHPALAPTRATPEFAEWIDQLGMADAWRTSGDWGDFCEPASDSGITCR